MTALKGRWLRYAALATMIAAVGLLAFSSLPTGLKTANGSSRRLADEAKSYLREQGFRPTATKAGDKPDEPSVPSMAHPLMGQPAPAISLRDHEGRERTLTEFLQEGPVVVVFYYGYYCDHCVAQLFALDADLAQFRRWGAQVLAISADESSHTAKQFATYGDFSFPVLSDPENRVAGAYGVYKPTTAPGAVSLLHATFIVDKSGIVRWCQYGLTPFTDNDTLLAELGKL